MKVYIKSNSQDGYLYIFKHGIGPGTLPSDVTIIRTKDLPNYYTAVWTDRFLTTEEMDQYDIPHETEINRYLDRIGYCQKDGDVVPCDGVEACGDITAADEVDKDFDVFMLMDYQADTGPDTMGMAGDRFSCLGKFYASSLEEAKKELKEIKDTVKSEDPDFYDVAYSGLYVTEYDETFDDSEEDPYYGMPVVYLNLSSLIDAVMHPEEYNGDDELPFDPTEETTSGVDKNFLDDILNEFTETISFDPDMEVAGASYNIKDDTVEITVVFTNGDTIDNWIEPISSIPLDGDRYTAINYLTYKLSNIKEEQ